MGKTYTKADDGTLQVSETRDVVETYDIEYLQAQREAILKDQERVALELAEVDQLISEAEKLGISAKSEGEIAATTQAATMRKL